MSMRVIVALMLAWGLSGCSKKPASPAGDSAATETPTVASDTAAPAVDGSAPSSAGEVRARALFAEMKQAYASLKTFRERGQTKTGMRRAKLEHPFFEITMRSWVTFARPDHLHTEIHAQYPFNKNYETAILWASGNDAAELGENPMDSRMFEESGVDLEAAWDRVVTGAAGVSPGVCWLMGDRLTGNVREAMSFLEALTDFELGADENIDGVPVHRITARVSEKKVKELQAGQYADVSEQARMRIDVTFWIDCNTLLLRRLKQSVLLEDIGELGARVGSGLGILVPDLVIEVTNDLSPEANPEVCWRELVFTNPHVLEDGAKAPEGYIQADIKRTRKSRGAARKEGRKILAAALKAYANCKSYRDTGVIEWKAIDRMQDRHAGHVEFKTAFKRPDAYRFEMHRKGQEDEWIDFVAWRGGNDVRSWTSELVGIHPRDNLASILDELHSSHGFDIRTVHGLFFEDPGLVSPLTRLKGAALLGTQKIEGVECHVIQGVDGDNRPAQLWIDRKTSLIRRCETLGLALGFPAWQVMDCKPAINKKIAAKSLAMGVKEE